MLPDNKFIPESTMTKFPPLYSGFVCTSASSYAFYSSEKIYGQFWLIFYLPDYSKMLNILFVTEPYFCLCAEITAPSAVQRCNVISHLCLYGAT